MDLGRKKEASKFKEIIHAKKIGWTVRFLVKSNYHWPSLTDTQIDVTPDGKNCEQTMFCPTDSL
jgi:hypothetical protein